MRKTTAGKRSSDPNKSGVAKTVDEYLAEVPEPARNTLQKIRATIRACAPAGTTEVISYRIPAFKSPRGMLMWYAAFSDHCSLFPTASVMDAFKKELRDYRVSKGTRHFPFDRPLPAILIKKMLKARGAEIEGKKRG